MEDKFNRDPPALTEARSSADAAILERRVGLVLRELAHEFGNLIFPLQMVMELQERSGKLTAEELNDILRAHIGELTIITRRFQRIGRCFSQRMEIEIVTARPADIVAAATGELGPAFDACGHSLQIETSGAPTTIQADPDLLQQALHELLENAVRFTPSGGRIVVTVQQRGGDVEFIVRDNGSGIAAELQPIVFEPFVHGGTKLDIGTGRFGCGLSLVARIARAHGGRAELRHSSDSGSEFALCLPVAETA
jgi:signal transduction histidine kinase